MSIMNYWSYPDNLSIMDMIFLTPHGIPTHQDTYRAKVNTARFLSNHQSWFNQEEWQAIRNCQPSFQMLLDLTTLILCDRGCDPMKELQL